MARQLGKRIADHPRAGVFRQAQQCIVADPDAKGLLEQYDAQTRRMVELEERHQPIEVADKHKLMDIQQRMSGNSALAQLMRAQADYVELMQAVSDAIEHPDELMSDES